MQRPSSLFNLLNVNGSIQPISSNDTSTQHTSETPAGNQEAHNKTSKRPSQDDTGRHQGANKKAKSSVKDLEAKCRILEQNLAREKILNKDLINQLKHKQHELLYVNCDRNLLQLELIRAQEERDALRLKLSENIVSAELKQDIDQKTPDDIFVDFFGMQERQQQQSSTESKTIENKDANAGLGEINLSGNSFNAPNSGVSKIGNFGTRGSKTNTPTSPLESKEERVERVDCTMF